MATTYHTDILRCNSIELGHASDCTVSRVAAGVVGVESGINFPATQVASSDANTLDDYEEGTWTPVLTFATAGDVNVVYSIRVGRYIKIGRKVFINLGLSTSTFTHTTAAGALQITGLPFTSETVASVNQNSSAMRYNGLKNAASANTEVWAEVGSATTTIDFLGGAPAVNSNQLTTANTTTGTNVVLYFELSYEATD